MVSGLIILENGDTAIFGTLITTRGILKGINTILPDLMKQEREQLLDTITDDELKQLIEKKASAAIEDTYNARMDDGE